jgi:hypothetical protein
MQHLTYPIIDKLSRVSKSLLLSDSLRDEHYFSNCLCDLIGILDNIEPSHKVLGMKHNAYISFRERYLLRKFWEKLSESTSCPIEDIEMRMLTRSFMDPAIYMTKVSEVFIYPVEQKEEIVNKILGLQPEAYPRKVMKNSKLYNKIKDSLYSLGVFF